MKLDDPQLTAYALGELRAAERSEIERHMRTDAKVALEIEETLEIARIVREGLRAEVPGALAEHQRAAIYRAAHIANEAPLPPSEIPVSHMFPPVRWWDRPGPWQAVAACAIVAFTVYALTVHPVRPPSGAAVASMSDLVMPVPNDGPGAVEGATNPELLSPNQRLAQRVAPGAPLDPTKTLTTVPDIKSGTPGVQMQAHTGLPPAMVSPEESRVAANDRPARGPRVVNAADPELGNRLAGADVARAENKPPLVNDEMLAGYLRARLKEAGRVQEGSSYGDLARVFRPVEGAPGRFEMLSSPSIKVDVQFETPEGQPLTSPPAPDSRIKAISKPYLEE